MLKRISAFGIDHTVDFSKTDSALHIPLNIATEVVPRLGNSPKVLRLADKIDARQAAKNAKRKKKYGL